MWRLGLFNALERFSEWRNTSAASDPVVLPEPVHPVADARAAVWLFVSTIGEVNAIAPFTQQLLAALGDPPLLLVTDRDTYAAAYRAKYPQAEVLETGGRTAPIVRAIKRRPPALLLIAEIPCLLHDAPCRLPFAAVHAARQAGAPVVLVNGWLYGYQPRSRLDRLERLLFDADYAGAFDLALVQTEAVRRGLIHAGADPTRVEVTGNIKFDGMQSVTAEPSALHAALTALTAQGRWPVLVAGSVTETEHQRAVIDAFLHLRRSEPKALLVLAPRHPEHLPRMSALREMLDASGLDFRYRSQHKTDAAIAAAGDLLVLDTMGELRGCYAAADAAFVGVDHNVLEPLAFGKPTFVFDGWEPTYPSYSVYCQLRDAGALMPVAHMADLGRSWSDHFRTPEQAKARLESQIETAIGAARGAVARSIESIRAAHLLSRIRGITP